MKRTAILAAAVLTAGAALSVTSCAKSNKTAEETAVVEDTIVPPTIDGAYILHVAGIENLNPDSVELCTTETGLKYITVTEGTGQAPTVDDSVLVHYTGKLTDGTVFDSSYQRNEPISFPLTQVIKGWTEGLQLMKEGGKTIFYIPADLAYGSRELPGIPANSPLIFEVELLKVEK